ncbi:Transposase for insertion sequence element IS904 [Exaiptasia diaphana]|nr:Transposase for insertion sequence element IS904 [Exaiptasia diaphana]
MCCRSSTSPTQRTAPVRVARAEPLVLPPSASGLGVGRKPTLDGPHRSHLHGSPFLRPCQDDRRASEAGFDRQRETGRPIDAEDGPKKRSSRPSDLETVAVTQGLSLSAARPENRASEPVAILDWYSRYVISWRLSNTMEAHFCIAALEEALRIAVPKIFNSDQGSQFTAQAFVKTVEDSGAAMSMDGRGRMLDNVFIERLWWSLKYEDVYIRDYATVEALQAGLERYFSFYNHRRFHQALDYRTPADVYFSRFPQDLRKSG